MGKGQPKVSVRRLLSTMVARGLVFSVLALALPGCANFGMRLAHLPPGKALTDQERADAIARAEVWTKVDVASRDLKLGPPAEEAAFATDEWVTCDHKEKKHSGHSLKFFCEVAHDHDVKVKYGTRNGEVIGEVLGTRLFWALGFAADRMYPVRVRCRGCSSDPWNVPGHDGEVHEFDPATIELKLSGRPMETRVDSGWKWSELEHIGPEAEPEARAHRDALKLLAAVLQHTDSKAANQRLLCPAGEEVGLTGCRHPVLMISDLGLTFGRASLFGMAKKGSVRFSRWSRTPVWKNPTTCVAQLRRSFAGTLKDPHIGEAGRAFLAELLGQLSDTQLHDLFESARVERRLDPAGHEPPASVDQWVAAFKDKREQIVTHHCPA
jgi:hypothetical protein